MDFQAKDMSVTLSGKPIIRDISLQVLGGSVVGLLGPNGCGKSTFLRCTYKALRPEHGCATLDDLDILTASNRDLARVLSVVSQFQDLSFDFSVMQMVLMGRTPFKKMLEADSSEDMEIAAKALRDVGLEGFEDRSYSTLSGGEKQRVVLARAIAQTPKFVILDEPTNHLDIKYQLKIMSIVRALGVGVLAAMHDLSLAAIFCDYIYVLKEGRVLACGTPEQVLTRELIYDVYDVDCKVTKDSETGRIAISYII